MPVRAGVVSKSDASIHYEEEGTSLLLTLQGPSEGESNRVAIEVSILPLLQHSKIKFAQVISRVTEVIQRSIIAGQCLRTSLHISVSILSLSSNFLACLLNATYRLLLFTHIPLHHSFFASFYEAEGVCLTLLFNQREELLSFWAEGALSMDSLYAHINKGLCNAPPIIQAAREFVAREIGQKWLETQVQEPSGEKQ